MAVTAVSTLYPPKLPTFAPAFVNTDSPKIYYELSPYNEIAKIRRLHISITNQATNESALTEPTGILLSEGIEYDSDKGMYFVTIPAEKIKNSTGQIGWITNTYYKLQIRFDSFDGGSSVTNNSDYFLQHLQEFSEWSTVCLLRAIEQPTLLLNNFDSDGGDASKVTTFNKGIIPISGQVFFGNSPVPTEKDTVQSFRVMLIPRYDEEPIYRDSGAILTGDQVNPNSLNYHLDLAGLEMGEVNDYRIRIYYLTKAQYQSYKDYKITVADFVKDDSFNPEVTVNVNDEIGSVTVKIRNYMSVFGTLHVRRSSSLTQFSIWEEIREETVAGDINLEIVDTTIQSGVWYRYIVQFENIRGALTPITYSPKFIPNFFGPFLSRGDKQIQLGYNYTISNMKPVVTRQKIDVIGGKYPKFAENAALNYKQFSVTGMISAQMDEFTTFMTKKGYFKDEYGNYNVYLEQNDINAPDYDQLWEREFREELVKWLNDGEPKLYRSQPEGNVVVMLTDVQLTPLTQLSRRLWNFSATMTEIADGNSLERLDDLGIYDCKLLIDKTYPSVGPSGGGGGGGDDPVPEYVIKEQVGQIDQRKISDLVVGNVDIINNYIMLELAAKYAGVLSNNFPSEGYIRNVKIQFHSKPHLFLQKTPTSPLQLIENPHSFSEEEQKKMILGYSFELNNQGIGVNPSSTIFVGKNGYYQIPNSIDVTSLFFPQSDDVVSVDYILHFKERVDRASIITGSTIEKTLVSQDNRTYEPGVWMGDSIRRRHTYIVPDTFYQRMDWWRGISVDCAPYAVFEILYQNGVLGEQVELEAGLSGVLNLLTTVPTQDLRFMGRRMHKVDFNRQRFAEDWEYCEDPTGQQYANMYEIAKPLMHVVYNIDGKDYLYYTNNKFYEIKREDNNVILAKVPVNGLLNYYGSIVRDSYG